MKSFLLMGGKSEEPFPEPEPLFINPFYRPHTIHKSMFLRKTGKPMKIHGEPRDVWEWEFHTVCPDCGYPQFCGCNACVEKIPAGYKPYTHTEFNPGDDQLRVCANCGTRASEDYWLDVEEGQVKFSGEFHRLMRGKVYAIPPGPPGEVYLKIILAHPEGKVVIPARKAAGV